MVTSRRSLIVAGNWPVNDPSLPAVYETTTPLPELTMRMRVPGGSDPPAR